MYFINDLRFIHPKTTIPPINKPPMAAPTIAPANVTVETPDDASTNQIIMRDVGFVVVVLPPS